jgi:hypothetical protein
VAQSDLMRIFKFTEEDLSYNRRGEFSPRQKAEEKENARGCRRTSGIFVLIAVGVVAAGVITGIELLQGLSVPLGIWGLLAFGAFLLTFSKSSLKVATARGKARLTMDRDRGATYHVLIVNGVYFRVSMAAYGAIEEGASYAVYYVPMSINQLLSIERIEDEVA